MSTTTPKLNFLPHFKGRTRLYKPLNAGKQEIRLIRILPNKNRAARIRCEIFTASLQDAHGALGYNALSYYWGSTENLDRVVVYTDVEEHVDNERRKRIVRRSYKVPVTRSLTGALRQFRAEATSENRSVTMWTDALCIHQLDARERAQQVSIMKTIFSSANSVWAWLGEGDPRTEIGLYLFHALSKDLKVDAFETGDHSFNNDAGAAQRASVALEEIVYTQNSDERFQDAIRALFNVPYWHRGWIFQEACANDSTRLCYSQLRFDLRSWMKLSDILYREGRRTQDTEILDLAMTLSSFYPLSQWHRMDSNDQASVIQQCPAEHTKSAMEFYANHTDWQTSDPRDRVYAVLGSLPGVSDLGININYDKPVEDVFIETSVAILNASQTWSHSQFTQPSVSHCLPSWAIDFTSRIELRDVDWVFHNSECFNAAMGAQFRLAALGSEKLITAGYLLDEIEWVSPNFGCCMNKSSPAFILNHQRTMSRTELQNHKIERVEHERNAFITRTAQRIRGVPPEFTNDIAAVWWRTMCAGLLNTETRFGTAQAAAIRDNADVKTCSNVLKRVWLNLEHSKPMITRKGYIGMVPLSAETGDSIAIIATGKLPFLLRKVEAKQVEGDAYIMKGGCYVDGEFHTPTYPSTN